MNIDYVTTYDAADVLNWSGSGYFISKSLEEQHARLHYIGNLEEKPGLYLQLKSMVHRLGRKSFLIDREISVARQYAKKIRPLIRADADVIFSPGTIPIALLESHKPKVFYADATFAGMIGFYDQFTGLSKATIEHGNRLEQAALDSSRLAIYTSDWAARTAIEHYKVDPEKVKVVPFGANIVSNRNLDSIRGIVSHKKREACHLLFMGVDWNRKRGDFAVGVAAELNSMGLKTILHIVGVPQLPGEWPDFIVNHGFLHKGSQADMAIIDQLMSDCHFLVLPTKAECYGLVFCEAGSFGLPSVATNVGGIPTIIEDDVNGKTFPLQASEKEYAAYIFSVFNNPKRYEELAYSSFDRFERKLNWKVAGRSVMELLRKL